MSYAPYVSAETTALRNGVMQRVYAWMTAGDLPARLAHGIIRSIAAWLLSASCN
jgi:hypothetical protein